MFNYRIINYRSMYHLKKLNEKGIATLQSLREATQE